MKLVVYIVSILVILTFGVFFILKLGWEPTPEIVMKPSFFNRAEEIGTTLLRRFYSPVAQKQLIAIGIPPQPVWQYDIVRGFLITAAEEKAPFDVVIEEVQMQPLNLTGIPPLNLILMPTNSETQSELIERVHQLQKDGQRILILTSSIFTAHFIRNSPINRYESITGEHILTITTGAMALKPDQENIIEPACVGSERDREGIAPLGCALLKASRGYYSRQLKNDRYTAIMNSPSAEDYLLAIAAPGGGVR